MRHRGFLSTRERQARSRLAKVFHETALIWGSLVTMARTCGNPGCKCTRGQKHVSQYLSVRVSGRRKMIYLPPDREVTVRNAVRTYQEVKRLMDEVSTSCLERFLRER